jgi:DNA-binding transcriptional ArsR family regulator
MSPTGFQLGQLVLGPDGGQDVEIRVVERVLEGLQRGERAPLARVGGPLGAVGGVRAEFVGELTGTVDWSRALGTFGLPVGKATRGHHFAVLRAAGLIEQRDEGPRRLNRLRRDEFDAAFPGLLTAVLEAAGDGPPR